MEIGPGGPLPPAAPAWTRVMEARDRPETAAHERAGKAASPRHLRRALNRYDFRAVGDCLRSLTDRRICSVFGEPAWTASATERVCASTTPRTTHSANYSAKMPRQGAGFLRRYAWTPLLMGVNTLFAAVLSKPVKRGHLIMALDVCSPVRSPHRARLKVGRRRYERATAAPHPAGPRQPGEPESCPGHARTTRLQRRRRGQRHRGDRGDEAPIVRPRRRRSVPAREVHVEAGGRVGSIRRGGP
jgi:hypothetical protein